MSAAEELRVAAVRAQRMGSPAFGLALADLLDDAADFLVQVARVYGVETRLALHTTRHALALARLVPAVEDCPETHKETHDA